MLFSGSHSLVSYYENIVTVIYVEDSPDNVHATGECINPTFTLQHTIFPSLVGLIKASCNTIYTTTFTNHSLGVKREKTSSAHLSYHTAHRRE